MDPTTRIGVEVATEVTTWSLAKIIKHIGYIFYYQENLNSLAEAETKLNALRNDGSRFVKNANRKLKIVSDTAALWRTEADKLYQNAQLKVPRNNISRLNLWSRYSTSKHAFKMAQEINEKVRTAPDFGTAIDRPPVNLEDTFVLKGFMEFESRKSVENDVWEALKDDSVKMCSLCGMGGTGKTMLTKKLAQRAARDRLFDKVGMATVTRTPNPTKIRSDIMSSLGFEFTSTDLDTSFKLFGYLRNTEESILLILDDVWEQLDLEDIGLPIEGLKFLLTSRSVDVCQKMGSHTNVVINVLTDQEAWGLFEAMAMESIEKLKVHDVARKIAEECGGLPLVIVPLATTLKYEVQATWNDSLFKLQKSNLLGISGMDKVYLRIQLSFDFLSEEAKSCFLLFCLFPEDSDVSVEQLIWYGKGLQLYKNVESMKEGRDRVESIVNKLKGLFFLLDGERDGRVRMHDIFREFAKEISSKEFIVGFEDVKKKCIDTSPCENCRAISFTCDEHLVDFRCPKLELLRVMIHKYDKGGFPDLSIGIFEDMEELKVLDLEVPILLRPLTALKKLRTLCVSETSYHWYGEPLLEIGDFLSHGDLKNLEFLEFSRKEWVDYFPEEIGLLCNLRCLYLGKMQVHCIPPGILSKLVKLEELELPLEFRSWGVTKEGKVNASLDEIESLSLTTLRISVAEWSISSKTFLENLTRFSVGVGYDYEFDNKSSATLRVYEVDSCTILESVCTSLLMKCHSLCLRLNSDIKNIICLQSVEVNEIPQWKDILVAKCSNMEYLVDTRAYRVPSSFLSQMEILSLYRLRDLKEICPCSKIEAPCFTNLSDINISQCPTLKHVFPFDSDLRQLKGIYIYDCEEMEQVVYRDQADDDANQVMEENVAKAVEKEVGDAITGAIIVFPKLKSVELRKMKTLKSFYDGNHAIEVPSLENLILKKCDAMEAISYGSFNAPRLKQIGILGTKFPNWERLNGTTKETYAENYEFQRWKDGVTIGCNEIDYLVDTKAERVPSSFLSNLESLKLLDVYGLKQICPFSKIQASCFSNLSELDIQRCPKLKHVFPLFVARELNQLRTIHIGYCEEMEAVFYTERADDANQIISSNIHHKQQLNFQTPNSFIKCLPASRGMQQPKKVISSVELSSPPIENRQNWFMKCVPAIRGRQPKTVSSPQNMDENVAKVEAHPIIFAQLRSLVLDHMLKLRVLYDGNHEIELPALTSLSISQCDEMETLSLGSVRAPKIKEIQVNDINFPPPRDDLNAIVKKMLNPEKLNTGNEIEEEGRELLIG